MIRTVQKIDAEAICRIYNPYILNSTITFEEQPVSIEEMTSRIEETTSALPWLVEEEAGRIRGYAYASKWKGRCAYRYAVESTVYLDPSATGHGLGSSLYRDLLECLRQKGLHTVIGGIALPNPASVALHEHFGMTKVAHFKEVGFKLGRWIDVGYWEKLL